MSAEQPREAPLPRFTAREAQMAEFLADAGNMLDALHAAEQRLHDQRQALDLAAEKLQQQCDRVDETTARFTKAVNSLEKASRERYSGAIVEMTRGAVQQALAEVRAAGQAERQQLHQPTQPVLANTEMPNPAPGPAATNGGGAPAEARPMPTATHDPLSLRPNLAPLWLRYPTANVIIGVGLLAVTYFFIW